MRTGWRRQDGFTLIELLVSLSIFSIISIAVYSSFAGGVGAWRRAEEFSSTYQTVRLLLDHMAQELKNAVVISDADFVGTSQGLSFLTLRQSPSTTGRPANHQIIRVTYEVRTDRASSGYSLFRLEASDMKNSQMDRGGPELMLGSISKLEFQYTYKKSKGEILPWKEVWEVSDQIPLGVKITLMVGQTRFTKMVFIPHGLQEQEDKAKG